MRRIFCMFNLFLIVASIWAQDPPPPAAIHPLLMPYDTSLLTGYKAANDSIKLAQEKLALQIIRNIENQGTHPVLKVEFIMLLGKIDNETSVKYLIEHLKDIVIVYGENPSSVPEGHTYMASLRDKTSLFALPYLCDFARSRCLDKLEILLFNQIITRYMTAPLYLDPQWVLYAAKGNTGERNNPCVIQNFERLIKHMREYHAFSY